MISKATKRDQKTTLNADLMKTKGKILFLNIFTNAYVFSFSLIRALIGTSITVVKNSKAISSTINLQVMRAM